MKNAKRNAGRIVGERLDKLGRGLGMEALTRLMRRTPVDTGHARGNWNVSVGDARLSSMDGRTEAIALSDGASVIAGFDLSRRKPLHVANGVPYIERLEEGHSKTQAPQGMARLTVQELQPLADRIAASLNRG